MRQRLKIPRLTNPPLRVEIIWRDAALDVEHDGPVGTGGGLREHMGIIGYLVNKDRENLMVASDFDYDDSSARTIHTIPRVHFVSITPWPRDGSKEN